MISLSPQNLKQMFGSPLVEQVNHNRRPAERLHEYDLLFATQRCPSLLLSARCASSDSIYDRAVHNNSKALHGARSTTICSICQRFYDRTLHKTHRPRELERLASKATRRRLAQKHYLARPQRFPIDTITWFFVGAGSGLCEREIVDLWQYR